MIIKGTSCAGAKRLAAHLTRTDTNERAEVKDIRGVVADDLLGALREMESVAEGARTTKPFYHGSINTPDNERLTDEQRMQAIDKLEAARRGWSSSTKRKAASTAISSGHELILIV